MGIGAITAMVNQALAQGGAAVLGLAYVAGAITRLSPCTLAMLPVLVGYLGGYEQPGRKQGFWLSLSFVLGSATTFAILGIIAGLFGQLFGQVGKGWQYLTAAVAMVMGLHLLGVIHVHFPTLQSVPVVRGGLGGVFVLGLLFGLVASPCSTPVLAVLVAYVSGQGQVWFGSLLLFVYGLGHGLPLLLAGTSAAWLKNLPALRQRGRYVTYGSGLLLVGLGLYLLIQANW